MSAQKCPKCGTWIKHLTNYLRHVKNCGEKNYTCEECEKSFARKDALKRHIFKKHSKRATVDKKFTCKKCSKSFTFEATLKHHQKSCGKFKPKPFKCPICKKAFASKTNWKHHRKYAHQNSKKRKREADQERAFVKRPKLPDTIIPSLKPDKEVTALKGKKVNAYFYPKTNTQQKDQQIYFKESIGRVQEYLKTMVKSKKGGIKWNLVFHCLLSMPDHYQGVPLKHSPFIRTPYPTTTTHHCQVTKHVKMAMEIVEEEMSKFMQVGSGWQLEENIELIVEVDTYTPISGRSYIPLPEDIAHTKAIINLQNEDDKCFMWSILSALHPPKKDPQRISKYKAFEDELNFNGMKFPIKIHQISKFEKQNPSISVTVIGCEEKSTKKRNQQTMKKKKSHLFPMRVPDIKKDKHITLLYWGKGKKKHYAWVKNLNRLLYNIKTCRNQTYFCERCFQGFTRQDLLDTHSESCASVPIERVQLLKKKIKFKSWSKTEETLFRVYADFECILQECEESVGESTRKVQKHLPCSMAWTLVSDHPDVSNRNRIYRPSLIDPEDTVEELSNEVVDALMESLQELEKELLPYQIEVKPMNLSPEEETNFQESTHCYMCNDAFQAKSINWKKVRDHNHATGQYRGAAHSFCNLEKKRSRHIPIFFHNLRGYDAHLIMRGIHRYAKRKQIKVIANTMERYVAFQVGSLRFLDSLQFLDGSLDGLAKNLTEYPYLSEQFPKVWEININDLPLLTQKGVYPYSYVKDFEVFDETKLPPKEAFHNDLTGDDITEEQYSHATQVWKTFKCQTLGEYHDLYLYTDIFLLADIVEAFRKVCIKQYTLDPAHYYTVPGLAWDAALKYSQVELDTISDIDIFQFIEKGKRGGISMISNRYAKANNPYLKEYQPDIPTSYIIYLDANNLYGHAMTQSLPTGDFQWIRNPQDVDVFQVPNDGDRGYILEVDLEYPQELHDLHSDYPLAAEKMFITDEMLSPFQTQLKKDLKYKTAKVEKLVPNLQAKQKYVIHYRNLKQAIFHGMKVTKIHRALTFKQKPWLKSYIELNTLLRSQAKSDFEKDFFKLMNNSVFGKTMEDVRKRLNIKLISNRKSYQKQVSKITYKRSEVFVNNEENEEYLVAVETKKLMVKLEKPIYTGFCVLELSKEWMYRFHYLHMMNKYGPEKATLLFTDTDSLTYHITTEDVYKDMEEDQHLYDTSNYAKNHSLFSNQNKKVIGKFKDETGGIPIQEWIGLRAKMYSLKLDDGHEKKTGKGIKKSVLKKEITHDDYKQCLFSQEEYYHSMKTFRSQQHHLYTVSQYKKSLSPYDDKRFILEDGCHTRAHGHYKNN